MGFTHGRDQKRKEMRSGITVKENRTCIFVGHVTADR